MTTNHEPRKRGRPEGSANKMAREAREMAKATGDGRLPHEILLEIARGNPQKVLRTDADGAPLIDPDTGEFLTKLVVPTLEDMQGAAKAAAPYFAPKMSTVEVIQGISDADLDQIIAGAAAEAGVSLSTGGEGSEEEATPADRSSTGRRRSVE